MIDRIIANSFILSLVFVLLFQFVDLPAQDMQIGQWRDHLPYNKGRAVAIAKNKIYCATEHCLFSYDKADNSIERINKTNLLSGIGVSTIRYHEPTDQLLIAYANGNMDLLQNNAISNISDIKRSSVVADKIINNILFIGNYAYLSCGFGIVVFDMDKREIKDAYLIGPLGAYLQVYDIAFDGTNLFAATSEGIYEADINNPNLINYSSWTKHTNISVVSNDKFNLVEFFAGNIYANFSNPIYGSDTIFEYNGTSWNVHTTVGFDGYHNIDVSNDKIIICHNWKVTIYDSNWNLLTELYAYSSEISPRPRHAIIDENNVIWIADDGKGLLKNWGVWNYEYFLPQGPGSAMVTDLAATKDQLWIAPGGIINGFENTWNSDGIFYMEEGQWSIKDKSNTSQMDTVVDIITVEIDPLDNKRVYAGCLGLGMLEFYDGILKTIYDNNNSSLQSPLAWYSVGVTDMEFDLDNNLWVINTGVSKCLSVKQQTDGAWQEFDFSEFLVSSKLRISGLVIDQSEQKWITLSGGEGIIVFNDNNTISNTNDDQVIILTTAVGNGGLPSSTIYSIAQDKDGEIWVGTDKGIAVFYSPENVFTQNDFDAQEILVQQGGYTQILMETEIVTAIAIDEANRKWIGTNNGGVFLISEDGTEEIYHFTEDNSPLFSDYITSIAINHDNGEVFIGTGRGLISYKGTATSGADDCNNILVYPNPVRESYHGPIAIKGLVSKSNVKITDITGNLMFETISIGGQAIWDGKSFDGRRAQTGIYLVFCSSQDGLKSCIAKILFVN